MIIYKNKGKGGFAAGANILTGEKLAAGGITAAVLILISLILGKGKKGSEKKKKRAPIILSAPLIYKAAESAVSSAKISSLVSRVKSGEDITADGQSDKIFRGFEVMEAEPIESEEEVLRIINPENTLN